MALPAVALTAALASPSPNSNRNLPTHQRKNCHDEIRARHMLSRTESFPLLEKMGFQADGSRLMVVADGSRLALPPSWVQAGPPSLMGPGWPSLPHGSRLPPTAQDSYQVLAKRFLGSICPVVRSGASICGGSPPLRGMVGGRESQGGYMGTLGGLNCCYGDGGRGDPVWICSVDML